MISFLIFALIVILVACVVIYVCDLLIGMLPGVPSQLGMIIRIVVILVALLAILQRGLPMIGEGRLL